VSVWLTQPEAAGSGAEVNVLPQLCSC